MLALRFALYSAKPPVAGNFWLVTPFFLRNVVEERSCDELYKKVPAKEAVISKV